MFGKLMKYELKKQPISGISLFRCACYSLHFAGLLASSVITGGINFHRKYSLNYWEYCCFGHFCGLHWLDLDQLYHYYSSFFTTIFFGREGYLTWTLPTGSHTVFTCKSNICFDLEYLLFY